jgi:hypothetical protein
MLDIARTSNKRNKATRGFEAPLYTTDTPPIASTRQREGERADTVRALELVLVEHAGQNAGQPPAVTGNLRPSSSACRPPDYFGHVSP